jgi:predicted O-methyltransferase YrrM
MDPHIEQLKVLASACRVVVEFGIGTCCSTLALLDGLPPDGRMTSVDIGDFDPHPYATADPRWTYIGKSDSVAPATILRLPMEPDLVFIDSSHTYEQTWRELMLADFLRTTRIALHDYLFPLSEDGNCRVKEAVDEFVLTRRYEWEILHQSHWGLAVLVRA